MTWKALYTYRKILYRPYSGGTFHNTAERIGFFNLIDMTRFYKYKKTDSIFSIFDISTEFNESVKVVFIKNNKLHFILKRGFTESQYLNIKYHILEYYNTDRGFKCEFSKEF